MNFKHIDPEKFAVFTLSLLLIAIIAFVSTVSWVAALLLTLFGAALLKSIISDHHEKNELSEKLSDIGYLLQNNPQAILFVGSVIATLFVLYFSRLVNQ